MTITMFMICLLSIPRTYDILMKYVYWDVPRTYDVLMKYVYWNVPRTYDILMKYVYWSILLECSKSL